MRYTHVIADEMDLGPGLRWAEQTIRMELHNGSVAVSISKPSRTLEQNDKFHAICNDVAKQAKFMGRTLSADQWKVLFISGHAVATNIGADVVPGLEGEFVNLRESTSRMSVSRLSSLIEYVLAWCVENEIKLSKKAE